MCPPAGIDRLVGEQHACMHPDEGAEYFLLFDEAMVPVAVGIEVEGEGHIERPDLLGNDDVHQSDEKRHGHENDQIVIPIFLWSTLVSHSRQRQVHFLS